jgi:hypothetical protein
MGFHLGKGWDKTSEDLFIHDSGARISKTLYRGKPGWWVFPVDLDAPPVEHAPTDAGREEAFATFEKGLPKPKPKAKEEPRKKKVAVPEDEDGVSKGGPPDADSDPEKDEADEEEKDE